MDYALYKGEECLYIGTIEEIAKELGIKENTNSNFENNQSFGSQQNEYDGFFPVDDDIPF